MQEVEILWLQSKVFLHLKSKTIINTKVKKKKKNHSNNREFNSNIILQTMVLFKIM